MSTVPPETTPPGRDPAGFEQTFVNQLAREFLQEQRRSRRWSIFFKIVFALYLLLFLVLLAGGESSVKSASLGDKHTALVDVEGVIAPDTEASADLIVSGLRAAFEDDRTAGVILRINSPGGSPVQAGYVNDEIY